MNVLMGRKSYFWWLRAGTSYSLAVDMDQQEFPQLPLPTLSLSHTHTETSPLHGQVDMRQLSSLGHLTDTQKYTLLDTSECHMSRAKRLVQGANELVQETVVRLTISVRIEDLCKGVSINIVRPSLRMTLTLCISGFR